MAPDPGKNAVATFTGDGATVDFAFGFPYGDAEDIRLTADGLELTRPGAWDFDPNDREAVIAVVAPLLNVEIIIRRFSNLPPQVTFVDEAPITADDLNNTILQGLRYIEEVEDLVT